MPSRTRSGNKSRNVSPGENYNIGDFSGDFRGANVNINIKSTLTNVQQSVGQIRTDDEASRKELGKLIAQLSETPNKTMVKITAEGLKQAAQNLADVMPVVATIAGHIALTVIRLIGV